MFKVSETGFRVQFLTNQITSWKNKPMVYWVNEISPLRSTLSLFCFRICSLGVMATSRLVTVAATQLSCCPSSSENVDAAEALVRRAAAAGAQVILLQELFSTLYFCQEQSGEHFLLAESEESSPLLQRFRGLAKELGVVRVQA